MPTYPSVDPLLCVLGTPGKGEGPRLTGGLQSRFPVEVGSTFLVRSHTVIRCTPNRREMDTTLSPLARAVRIASTWLSDMGVLARLLGFATTPGSGSEAASRSSPRPSFAWFHAELSRSNRCQVFGLSPPASTSQKARSVWTGPSSSWRPARRRDPPVTAGLRSSDDHASTPHSLFTACSRRTDSRRPHPWSPGHRCCRGGAAGPVRPTQ